jgi:hypothetical protein
MTSSMPIENFPAQELPSEFSASEVQNSKAKMKKEQLKITIEKKTESAESPPMGFDASSFDDGYASPCDLVNPACTLCNKVFSKRKLRLKYHCGMCERAVCSACAPSNVHLEGYTGLQKVCTPCIANASKVSAAQSRLVRLGEQLDVLAGKSTGPSSVAAKCTNLEEALDFSESAIAPLKDLRDRLAAEKANSEKLKKALQETEKRVRAQLEQDLKVSKSSSCPEKQPEDQAAGSSSRMPRGMNCANSCKVM